ncbi:hypothetical protein PMAYCL1PPCAC_14038, partial [Pristionchus mayeri]
IGLVTIRNTGSYTFLLVFESLLGALVAISNIIVIAVLIIGRNTLMTSTFYIMVANVMVFTSLKAIVELGFILPYYMMKSETYDVTRMKNNANYSRHFFRNSDFLRLNMNLSRMILSCFFAWACSALIPLLFFICECQFVYRNDLITYHNECKAPPGVKAYYNVCEAPPAFSTVVKCILYLSYVCCVVEILLYMIIFLFLKKKRSESLISARQSNSSRAEMKLLRQSLLIFGLYAASILSVLILSFIPAQSISISQLSYTENILNLLIAAIYPICILAMSGDMKR